VKHGLLSTTTNGHDELVVEEDEEDDVEDTRNKVGTAQSGKFNIYAYIALVRSEP
jgi:hypothetical protein